MYFVSFFTDQDVPSVMKGSASEPVYLGYDLALVFITYVNYIENNCLVLFTMVNYIL